MTNLFPKEALDHFKDNKVVEKIRQAQENYEIRDLLLSVWARKHPELVLYENQKKYLVAPKIYQRACFKRVIVYNNKVYPFKQSAPHKLVDLFIDWCEKESKDYENLIRYHSVLDEFYNFVECDYDEFSEYALFFCSQEYTKQTGIEPYIGDYDKIVKEYIKYLQWKIDKKEKL